MDYNIEHYTIKDLEEMFNLKHPYTPEQVYQMETNMKNKVFNECGYTTKYSDMTEFISSAINKILFQNTPSINQITNQDVIIQPSIPTLHAKEKPFIRGNLNELSISTITRSLTINSKFRPDITLPSSSFSVDLPYPIHQVVNLTLDNRPTPVKGAKNVAFTIMHC